MHRTGVIDRLRGFCRRRGVTTGRTAEDDESDGEQGKGDFQFHQIIFDQSIWLRWVICLCAARKISNTIHGHIKTVE